MDILKNHHNYYLICVIFTCVPHTVINLNTMYNYSVHTNMTITYTHTYIGLIVEIYNESSFLGVCNLCIFGIP